VLVAHHIYITFLLLVLVPRRSTTAEEIASALTQRVVAFLGRRAPASPSQLAERALPELQTRQRRLLLFAHGPRPTG
jgi:hypothetical protein